MDQAHKGEKALETKDYPSAIEAFTKAIATNSESPKYYINRSTAYSRTSPAEHEKALADAEAAVVLAGHRAKRELIAEAQQRRGIVLYALQQYGNASRCFEWVKKLNPNEKTLGIWEARIKTKLDALSDEDDAKVVTVDEIPGVKVEEIKRLAGSSTDYAKDVPSDSPLTTTPTPQQTASEVRGVASSTPANKIRHDWYQTNDTITLDVMAKGVPNDKAVINIEKTSLSMSFPLASGSDFNLDFDPLFDSIDTVSSSFRILSTKIQCTLKKANPGKKWKTLEGVADPDEKVVNDSANHSVQEKPTSGPSYPTSSKSGPKNWDKVATDLSKKPKKEDEEEKGDDEGYDSEEGDAVNGFFKKLYKNLDPDARRAMMKSYQESNGTALSTNWDEVKKGKVETTPPDGMEARKWEG